ncbi:alpha-2,8-polysialyltransferase family protein, partial [Schleiferiaceae bacterium]|nr:alpha-2,8-polysialyltransferase family protein [Schleiferiaceae bacterium]
CTTTWHVDVLCSYFIGRNVNSDVVVFLTKQSDTNSDKGRLSEDEVRRRFMAINICVQIYPPKDLKRHLLREIRTTVLWPGGINKSILVKVILNFCRFRYIAYDEGTSTYYPRGKRGISGISRRSGLKAKLLELVEEVIYKLPFVSQYYMLSKYGVNCQFSDSLSRFYDSLYLSDNRLEQRQRNVILVLDYDDLIDRNEIFNFYIALLQDLKCMFELPVIISFHPNSKNKYLFEKKFKNMGFKINEKHLSAEELVWRNTNNILVYGISTAGLIMSVLGVHTSLTYSGRYHELKSIDSNYLERINYFRTYFGRFNLIKDL